MALKLLHLCWSAMFGDANCCNLPKVVHHQRGIIIFGNNQYWIVKPEDEMPNEACARSLSLSVSLSVELWQMNLQGKIAERQPEATEASLSSLLYPKLGLSSSFLFLSLQHVERMCTWWCFCCKPACNVGWLFQALHDFEFPVLSFIR